MFVWSLRDFIIYLSIISLCDRQITILSSKEKINFIECGYICNLWQKYVRITIICLINCRHMISNQTLMYTVNRLIDFKYLYYSIDCFYFITNISSNHFVWFYYIILRTYTKSEFMLNKLSFLSRKLPNLALHNNFL